MNVNDKILTISSSLQEPIIFAFLKLNKRVEFIYGKNYLKFRKLLRNHREKYDNTKYRGFNKNGDLQY